MWHFFLTNSRIVKGITLVNEGTKKSRSFVDGRGGDVKFGGTE